MSLLSFKKTFESEIFLRPIFMEEPGPDASPELRALYQRWLVTGVTLPIHVARLNRAQLAAVDDGWRQYCVEPRGADAATREQWVESNREPQFSYLSKVIEEHVTLDAGLIDIEGVDITDGAGLLRVFYGRLDVLSALVTAVRSENRLVQTLAKNSKSPSASATGSAPSTQEGAAPAGSTPERTATSADSSNSAPADAATGTSEKGSADGSKSSRSGADGAVH